MLVHCKARYECWVTGTAPMLRTTGDFTVKLGNTTWILRGVYFDTPNPDGNPSYAVDDAPLTRSEAALPPGVHVGAHNSSYALPHTARTAPVALARLRLAVAGPDVVHPGERVGYRVALTRTQPEDRVVQAVTRDIVLRGTAGNQTRRWKAHGLHRHQTRTREIRVTVPGGARRSFCFTATAASPQALPGRTTTCARVVR